MIAGKVWGTTTVVYKTPIIEIHYLVIQPRRQCSLHMHEYKWNGFLVQSGTLTIVVKKRDYDLEDKTILKAGDFTAIKPGEYHRFISGRQLVRAWEVYFPEALSEDIIRQDCGSIVSPD